jgi:outer membrane lipoprotein-sorting protein
MKTISFLFALVVALSICSQALASDKAKEKDKAKPKATEKAKKTEAQTSEEGVLTGSYIKQKVRRQGMITDGANNVVVIDRNTIERSGASDVRQLLIHQGIR